MSKSLGDRMKEFEAASETRLIRRVPVVVRIDGRAFHTLTRNIERPFDMGMSIAMAHTLEDLCKATSGCVYGYTQSDEMTLLLQNDANLDTEPLFDNRVQKLTSVIASMATLYFDRNAKAQATLDGKLVGDAFFDARVFAVPSWTEAANCLIWRQQDATKNAISMAAQATLGAKLGKKTAQNLLHGKNGKEQQELMFQQAGVNFHDYPVSFRRGLTCTKTEKVLTVDSDRPSVLHYQWKLNWNPPILRLDPTAQFPLNSTSIQFWGSKGPEEEGA